MEKIKILNFQPNIETNYQGKSFIFKDIFSQEAEKKIDYSNYYTMTSNTFLTTILERQQNCLFKNKWFSDLTEKFQNISNLEEYLLTCIKDIYEERKNQNLSYYYFIPMVSLIEIINDSIPNDYQDKADIQNDINYIFNFNKYNTGTIYDNYDETSSNYRAGQAFIGVNEIKDYSKQLENEEITKVYNFSYYEFNYKEEEIYKSIYKIKLIGPVGTCFLLNYEPYLIYITSLVDPDAEIRDYTKGVYELDTQGQILLKSIIFPKDAVPEINGEIKNVSISLYYEDEE